jgi:hypothetical protein
MTHTVLDSDGMVCYTLCGNYLTGNELCGRVMFTKSEMENSRDYVASILRKHRRKIRERIQTINKGINDGCFTGSGVHIQTQS